MPTLSLYHFRVIYVKQVGDFCHKTYRYLWLDSFEITNKQNTSKQNHHTNKWSATAKSMHHHKGMSHNPGIVIYDGVQVHMFFNNLLSHEDYLIYHSYDIETITISYGRLTNSSAWHSCFGNVSCRRLINPSVWYSNYHYLIRRTD